MALKVKYMQYLRPEDPEIKAIANYLKKSCKTRESLPFKSCRWVNENAFYAEKGIERNGHFTVHELFKTLPTTCFHLSVLLCSILRAMGFTEEEAFVVVIHKRATSLLSLHAIVILLDHETDGGYILDPSGGISLYVRSFKKYYELCNFIPLTMFNDKKAYIGHFS